ncbi:HAMP domain-containing sensor histidine kinase (plasmid) [Paraburkholderia sp. 22B1P]|nr:HAMP domain-containing sensor histidine kinase [Paraburkholderia sp. 22B1P]
MPHNQMGERVTRTAVSTQLAILWSLVATLCLALIGVVLLVTLSAQGQQIALAQQQSLAACDAVASRYDLSLQTPGAANLDLMHAVLDIVLARMEGVEGGFWSPPPSTPNPAQPPVPPGRAAGATTSGFLAYAFPSYQGSGIKRDIPEAETPLILDALTAASRGARVAARTVRNGQDAVLATACPVAGHPGLYVWMLTRARPALGVLGETSVTVLAVVLAVLLGVSLYLAIALRNWRRKLDQLERALSVAGEAEASQEVPLPGERDLDRIAQSVHRYLARTRTLQQQALKLEAQLAQAERFAALGKLAAQVAHEIRNPTGAIRLKAENALAGDSARQQSALRSILGQLERIESQVASLLALTQPVILHYEPVDLSSWVHEVIDAHRESALAMRITLSADVAPSAHPDGSGAGRPVFDATHVRRAVDNLLLNALQHAPDGGRVTLDASRLRSPSVDRLLVHVTDDGPGVPEAERERIFEPFITGRAEGSGLGLALVREVASAHRGRAYHAQTNAHTCFVIDIPWQPSS